MVPVQGPLQVPFNFLEVPGPGLVDGLCGGKFPDHYFQLFPGQIRRKMELCFRQVLQPHFFQQFRKGENISGFFLGKVEGPRQRRHDLAGLLTAQAGAAENVFIHIGEEPGMDGADIAKGVFPQFLDHPAQSVRIQQMAVSLGIQPEMPGAVFPDHGPAQVVPQLSGQLPVVFRRVFIDVDFPHLAAGMAAGPSFAGKIVEPFRDDGNHGNPSF